MEEKEKTTNISMAIVKTIAFFDIFDRALTPFEIWQYLGVKCLFKDVVDELNKEESGALDLIKEKNGYYFLKDREKNSFKKTEQYNFSNQKIKIAKKAARLLRVVNGVKMVAVCNNICYKKTSDIDLLIVVSPKRMWLTRALVTAVIHIFGLRRHGRKITNRICLSFYITEDSLNLKDVALKGDDPYFYYWLVGLIPIYGQEMYNKFWEGNSWIKDVLPNAIRKETNYNKIIKDNTFSKIKKYLNTIWFNTVIGDFLEQVSKKIQLKKMSHNISVSGERDTRVIISDTILKFHESDRREEFRDEFKKRINLLFKYEEIK